MGKTLLWKHFVKILYNLHKKQGRSFNSKMAKNILKWNKFKFFLSKGKITKTNRKYIDHFKFSLIS